MTDILKLCDEIEASLKGDISITALLYTDTIGGSQTLRDDLWAISTSELRRMYKIKDAAQPMIDAVRNEAKLRATVKYYEDTLCFPLVPAKWLDEDVTANEVRPSRVADVLAERERLRERIKELERQVKEKGK